MNRQPTPDDDEMTLGQWSKLHRFSRVGGTLYRHIRSVALSKPRQILQVLDLASGSGDFPIAWAVQAKKESLAMEISTLDFSEAAVDFQHAAAERAGVTIHARQGDCLTGTLPRSVSGGFDVVICSCFMHQLDHHQAFCLLQSMQQACTGSLLVCDVERSRTSKVILSVASRCLSRSHAVHQGAAASVRAAFTQDEFAEIAKDALARPLHMQRILPCCFLMTVDGETVSESATESPVAFA